MRMMIIQFTQDGGRAGVAIMARMFDEGWRTFESLRWYPCGHYHTVLYLPGNVTDHLITEAK